MHIVLAPEPAPAETADSAGSATEEELPQAAEKPVSAEPIQGTR